MELGLKRICSCSEASASGAVEFAIDQRSNSLMSGMAMIMKSSMRKEMRQDEDEFIWIFAAPGKPAELGGNSRKRWNNRKDDVDI